MYKIYINETPLLLVNTADLASLPAYEGEILKARYTGKPKFLLHYVDMLEKSRRFAAVALYATDEKQIFRDLKRVFKTIKAAGGLVLNPKREALLIFRRGFWDLPKGKIDRGEGKKEAATREVREETGLEQLEVLAKIGSTYHTYREESGRRILKKTYWYLMETTDNQLIPQAEEDIEEAVWSDLAGFPAEGQVVYKNILEVIEKGKKLGNKAGQ